MPLSGRYSINAVIARGLVEFAAQRKIDIIPLAATAGLDPKKFQDVAARVSLQRMAHLFELLASVSGDEAIGLKYAQAMRLGAGGAYSFGLMNAPDLRTVVEFYSRYTRLYSDIAHIDVRIGKSVEIEWQFSPLIVDADQITDIRMLLLCRMLRLSAGPHWQPSKVEIARREPESKALHRKLLARNIKFGAAANKIVFPSALLTSKNAGADLWLFEFMQRHCEQELHKFDAGKNIVSRVREAILSNLQSQKAVLGIVARELAVSERSLQRRLAAEGADFQQLVGQIRHELSNRLLAETDLRISEIAHRCGYQSSASYSRAALSWYGMSPANFRQKKITQLPALSRMAG